MTMDSEQTFKIDGKDYSRIPFGSEQADTVDDLTRCPDCGAAVGTLHDADCNFEECPACHDAIKECACAVEKRFDFESHAQIAASLYLEKRDFFKSLSIVVRNIIVETLKNSNVKVHSVQDRAKDPISFRNKAAQPSEIDPKKPKYAKPLDEINGLVSSASDYVSPKHNQRS